ncbi:MAG: methyltransferase [Alphaproteobacteria bacterium]|nr:MAG: methyltransferase [Alphaproteobacteria bacterium]
MNSSVDAVYEGKVILRQPMHSYRAGLDAAFLGASVHANPHERILDVGCGVGTALLCALYHQPHARGCGIEGTEIFATLAKENADTNNRICVIHHADIFTKPSVLGDQTFDHVITNPPYHSHEGCTPSPHALKAVAAGEPQNGLVPWLNYCIRRLKPRGHLTMVHRTDRLDEILAHLYGRMGEITLVPLFTQPTHAKRILIRARKNVCGGLTLCPGIHIHTKDGSYTPIARGILSGETKIDLFS